MQTWRIWRPLQWQRPVVVIAFEMLSAHGRQEVRQRSCSCGEQPLASEAAPEASDENHGVATAATMVLEGVEQQSVRGAW